MSKTRRISASIFSGSAKSGSCQAIGWRIGAPRLPSLIESRSYAIGRNQAVGLGGRALRPGAKRRLQAPVGAGRGVKNGRASCRERVCQYEEISVGGVSLTKKQKTQKSKGRKT